MVRLLPGPALDDAVTKSLEKLSADVRDGKRTRLKQLPLD